MKAIITCESGSCIAYPSGEVLNAGGSVSVPFGPTAEQLPAGEAGDKLKATVEDAATAPGVGCNGKESGVANIKADGGAMRVRQYLAVNPFLSPDAADYEDMTLADGDNIATDMIQENAKTLVVLGAA